MIKWGQRYDRKFKISVVSELERGSHSPHIAFLVSVFSESKPYVYDDDPG
jgi:hypothetical protein